jgi:transcription initiation factor TFIID subunit 1
LRFDTSCHHLSCIEQGRGSLERLEITGAGDPSGRGLGFSYLRVATKPPNVGAIVEKKAAVARGGGAVTGTDADLRRLSMDAAREVDTLNSTINCIQFRNVKSIARSVKIMIIASS